MSADAGGLFSRRDQPLIEGIADTEALGFLFNDDITEKAASGKQARLHGVLAREHAVENEGHVVVFPELQNGKHGFAANRRCLSGKSRQRGLPGAGTTEVVPFPVCVVFQTYFRPWTC